MSDISIPDENVLTWDQVKEFRSDQQSRADYRRLVHWLDADMVGKSGQYVADEIQVRLEHYEAALRKHGVETLLGAVESLFDARFIAAASAVAASIAIAADKPFAAAGVALLCAGKAACSIARSAVNIGEVRLGKNAEIAAVYRLKRAAQNAG